MNDDLLSCLDRIDALTEQITQATAKNEAHAVEQLVIEQCQQVRSLESYSREELPQERIRHIHQAIERQQAVIEQALDVTNHFLKKINELRPFSRMG